MEKTRQIDAVVGFSVNPEVSWTDIAEGGADTKSSAVAQFYLSGTSYDVALALSILRKKVHLVAALGKDDSNNLAIKVALRSAKINATLLKVRGGTPIASIEPQNRRRLSFKPPVEAFSQAEVQSGISRLEAKFRIVTGLTQHPNDILLAKIILGDQQSLRVLNPRLSLVENPAVFADILNHTDIVFLNKDEAVPYIGRDCNSVKDFAPFFDRSSVDTVIMTKGEKGSVLASRDGTWFEEPAHNAGPLQDETGAGDCFLGYLIAGRLEGWPWDRAMRFATVAAGLKVTRIGTTNIPLRDDVEKVLEVSA